MKEIQVENLTKLTEIVEQLKDPSHIKIGLLGSRKFILAEKFKGSRSLNDLYATALNKAKETTDPLELRRLYLSLIALDSKADEKLKQTKLAKLLHFIPHAWGKIFFDRNKAQAEILKKIASSSADYKVGLNQFSKEDLKDLQDHFTTLQKWYQKVDGREAQGKTFSDTVESRQAAVRDELVNAFFSIKEIFQKNCLANKSQDFKDTNFDIEKMSKAITEICQNGKDRLFASVIFVLERTSDGPKDPTVYVHNNYQQMLDALKNELS